MCKDAELAYFEYGPLKMGWVAPESEQQAAPVGFGTGTLKTAAQLAGDAVEAKPVDPYERAFSGRKPSFIPADKD